MIFSVFLTNFCSHRKSYKEAIWHTVSSGIRSVGEWHHDISKFSIQGNRCFLFPLSSLSPMICLLVSVWSCCRRCGIAYFPIGEIYRAKTFFRLNVVLSMRFAVKFSRSNYILFAQKFEALSTLGELRSEFCMHGILKQYEILQTAPDSRD